VLGSGGIMSGRDAMEFIACGAHAVQVGTASFIRPCAALEVLEEIEAHLRRTGARSLDDVRGTFGAGTTQSVVGPAPPAPRLAPVAARGRRAVARTS
jgi:isopentenyl diphosphate isomerase/L-lactate dehydrogenase-like FMN-dependent dehydrogenase